ncbi:Uncharacterized protein F36G3.2 [Toxocara canis]|nr:Uncharacterized protein F36G3.2 [Toxocara canis]
MAFIGFYIVKAEARGSGIGTNLWNRAIKRIGTKLTALRAVPRMLPKYEARGFPIRGRQLYKYFLPSSKLISTFSVLVPEHQTQHIISFSEVNHQQRTALHAYDKYVTGRDRSQFLQLFMNHEQVRGKILLSATGEIIGYSAIVPTGLPERRLYKLAPLYADQLYNALSLALCILREHQQENKDSEIVILTVEDSIGSEQLNPIIENAASITAQQGGVTLFNADPFPSMRMLYAKCYIPHNNSSHYDA